MKNLFFIIVALMLTGFTRTYAQTPPVNPIPTFNYQMNEQSALFHETKGANTAVREKRDMDVVINTRSTWVFPTFALVWVFRINPLQIKGPYLVFPDAHLVVPIDEGKWGVLVRCNDPVDVSVWVD